MIEKSQLESCRALAAKPAHDSIDASKALVALPVLLAEVDRLRRIVDVAHWFVYDVKIERAARAHDRHFAQSISSQKALATFEQLVEIFEAGL